MQKTILICKLGDALNVDSKYIAPKIKFRKIGPVSSLRPPRSRLAGQILHGNMASGEPSLKTPIAEWATAAGYFDNVGAQSNHAPYPNTLARSHTAVMDNQSGYPGRPFGIPRHAPVDEWINSDFIATQHAAPGRRFQSVYRPNLRARAPVRPYNNAPWPSTSSTMVPPDLNACSSRPQLHGVHIHGARHKHTQFEDIHRLMTSNTTMLRGRQNNPYRVGLMHDGDVFPGDFVNLSQKGERYARELATRCDFAKARRVARSASRALVHHGGEALWPASA